MTIKALFQVKGNLFKLYITFLSVFILEHIDMIFYLSSQLSL